MDLEEWKEYKSILKELEPYQQKVQKVINPAFKRATMLRGPQPNTSPYTKKVSAKSGESGLGPLEEEAVVPEIKEDLNRDIWTEDNKLDPAIAKRLLRIANDFYEKLDLPAPILDITFTGSMANYNWTEKSDIDLHIVIDYNAVNEDKELVKSYLMEAKSNWNRNHEIMIKGHEVEIYVQDSNEPHHSTAVYSILRDKWEIIPERAEFEVSEDAVRQKSEAIKSMIEFIESLYGDQKYEEVYGDADRLRVKLRNYRQCGLEQGGEYSVENLVFKALRNEGELDKLSTLKKDAYDSMMSVKESKR